MNTFKFTKEGTETRAQLLERIMQVPMNSKLSYKLYKQLRIKDKVSDEDAYSYYRQLDEYVVAAKQ